MKRLEKNSAYAWGSFGVVTKVTYWNDDSEEPDAVEFVSPEGDILLAKMKDLRPLAA